MTTSGIYAGQARPTTSILITLLFVCVLCLLERKACQYLRENEHCKYEVNFFYGLCLFTCLFVFC